MKHVCALLLLTLSAASTAWADTPKDPASANREIVLAFNDLVFNQHDAATGYARYAAPDFHHHAQWSQHEQSHEQIVGHNIESFKQMALKFPKSHREVKQVVAQGDLVVLHSLALDGPGVGDVVANMKKGGKQEPKSGEEVVDIYRLANGKIVEHWEVSQVTTSLDDVF